MNVPDNIWEQISELLDLGISLMKRITKEDDEKAKEFEQRSQKQREEMEAFRKKHFPNDD